MGIPVTLVWFRQDLRVADNPALVTAAKRGYVVPVYIWAPEEEGTWPPGGAAKWWLHHSLASLASEMKLAGSPLVLRQGATLNELLRLASETSASAVFWNRRYEPASIARDKAVEAGLRQAGIETATFNASLLREPWTMLNKSGKPYQVFTAYWRACVAAGKPDVPFPAPRAFGPPRSGLDSIELDSLCLEPRPNWARSFPAHWQPGSRGARAQLARFIREGLDDYAEARSRPDRVGTSRLSPHLHFGEFGPRQVWQAVTQGGKPRNASVTQFLAELGWREFSCYLLYHFPHTAEQPLRAEFADFPWRDNAEWRNAWQKGRTGYPLVDAGMRELWETGWMHNRVRMIVASFLAKNLALPWQQGTRWFWDTLVDADLANNTLGWQWTAGCGADAAPFYRIFNPVAQGEKFDSEGTYVRRWVPELAGLPGRWVHKPWQAPQEVLARAGVALGKTYPEPIVGLFSSRHAALAAYERMRASNRSKSAKT